MTPKEDTLTQHWTARFLRPIPEGRSAEFGATEDDVHAYTDGLRERAEAIDFALLELPVVVGSRPDGYRLENVTIDVGPQLLAIRVDAVPDDQVTDR
jgi:hypothetical protein